MNLYNTELSFLCVMQEYTSAESLSNVSCKSVLSLVGEISPYLYNILQMLQKDLLLKRKKGGLWRRITRRFNLLYRHRHKSLDWQLCWISTRFRFSALPLRQQERRLACKIVVKSRSKISGVNNTPNDGWIPFSCFSFRVLPRQVKVSAVIKVYSGMLTPSVRTYIL